MSLLYLSSSSQCLTFLIKHANAFRIFHGTIANRMFQTASDLTNLLSFENNCAALSSRDLKMT
jgi:hypothetical protein